MHGSYLHVSYIEESIVIVLVMGTTYRFLMGPQSGHALWRLEITSRTEENVLSASLCEAVSGYSRFVMHIWDSRPYHDRVYTNLFYLQFLTFWHIIWPAPPVQPVQPRLHQF